jgi:hypothetical protein
VLRWLRRSKTPAVVERAWTPQDYLYDAKGERMAADYELGAAIEARLRFEAQHPPLMQIDGKILEQFLPEQKKLVSARESRAHAALMRAQDREAEVIRQYAPSKEVRYIGGIRCA